MNTEFEAHPNFCESYPHPEGDGEILLLPNKDITILDIEKQVSWSVHTLSNGQNIGIGRVTGGQVVAIHLTEDGEIESMRKELEAQDKEIRILNEDLMSKCKELERIKTLYHDLWKKQA